MNPIPSLLSMLICDKVIVEEGSKKKTLVGLFENINAPVLPVAVSLAFFARITDGEGEYNLRLDLVYPETSEVQLSIRMQTIRMNDRLHTVDLLLNLPPIPFGRTGRHEFQLYCDDVYLGHVPIDVKMVGVA